MNPSTSERTPLVQPAYAFESSLSRRYHKRLRTFQCCLCVGLLAILGVALLVSVSYTLDEKNKEENTTNVEATTEVGGNLTLTSTYSLKPLLKLSWPRPDSSPGEWVGEAQPDNATLSSAVALGTAALEARRRLEAAGGGGTIERDSPAARAQQASATAANVIPLADTAYATEHATKALTDGSSVIPRNGGVGRGPRVNAPWSQPPYCDEVRPTCAPSPYRTIDGTCNNPDHPLLWGVAFTPFRRALAPDYSDGVSAPRQGLAGSALPSAREVSVRVHRPRYSRDSIFTVMLAVWGQFLDHDITATALSKGANGSAISCCHATETPGLVPHPECFPVRLDAGDPFYQSYNVTCMEFVRSAPAPTCFYGPREQLNQATSFIDGSVIYGATDELAQRLRSGVGGRLRMLLVEGMELLPPSMDPNDGCNTEMMNAKGKYCFESGDARANENLHLTTMHLIWARQHNKIAEALHTLNPQWDDETLFQQSRKIVGAQMQHITYSEFLPIVLGTEVMSSLNISADNGTEFNAYNPTVDPSIANHFAAAAFRFAHTLLPGLMQAVNAHTGSAEYVHLHEMLFNPYSLYSPHGAERAINSALDTKVNRVDPHVTDELSNHLFERTVNTNGTLKTSGPCGLDLVSLNIQRGRDHGLQGYPAWREHCGLSRPRSFDDLQDVFDDDSLSRVKSIYNRVEDVDLYTGALSEQPGGRLLGPTLTCLVADQFLRLRIGDRYWYETREQLVAFTAEQLLEIRKTSLAGVICSNADSLPKAQHYVMESAGDDNPLIPCKDIPLPDWTQWKSA